ncbi:YpsA SLOG family protein [Alteromonas sp. 14N.309.X.WAT.G.H12]|uniref:YpsA SLOG family protein n=1 Tax=Alteromonas sp. 14N.309.X.WAT.G.H12 TaxID=3120824 RepID=UPI002FD23328
MKPLAVTRNSPLLIISGGQTGADRAGLDAAYKLRIPTSGYVPKGFRTENGPDYTLRRYNVVEHTSTSYVPRTRANIQASDVTLVLSPNRQSKGTKTTLQACVDYNKPHVILTAFDQSEMQNTLAFFRFFSIKVINVAGNRESVHPGLHVKGGRFLLALMSEHLREKGWLKPDPSGRTRGRFCPT